MSLGLLSTSSSSQHTQQVTFVPNPSSPSCENEQGAIAWQDFVHFQHWWAPEQAMTNIGELLQAGGSSFKHVVFAKILLADMSDFQAVNETFKSYFTPDTYPARSLCQVVKMPKNGRVKIDVVAIAEKP
ncbi:hypothetical protein niasHT_039401 [Heterodera trifolii]|uniref:Uncharacterized protein n=1 Tax=Heterodera trifolii TaxID=157864 RepID=A0ABD2J829_9BILA